MSDVGGSTLSEPGLGRGAAFDLRSLRKLGIVSDYAQRGVVRVMLDPRHAGVDLPAGCRTRPAATLRLSQGFSAELILSTWGFEQTLTFEGPVTHTCRAPWTSVYVVIAGGWEGDDLVFPFLEDAPTDAPIPSEMTIH